MKTWTCSDCLTHNCEDKQNYPYRIVRIGAEIYCGRFWNPLSEPFFSDKGATNIKK